MLCKVFHNKNTYNFPSDVIFPVQKCTEFFSYNILRTVYSYANPILAACMLASCQYSVCTLPPLCQCPASTLSVCVGPCQHSVSRYSAIASTSQYPASTLPVHCQNSISTLSVICQYPASALSVTCQNSISSLPTPSCHHVCALPLSCQYSDRRHTFRDRRPCTTACSGCRAKGDT